MSIEGGGGSDQPSPEDRLRTKWEKHNVSEDFFFERYREARRRFLRTEPTDYQKGAVWAWLRASDRIENIRDDKKWAKGLSEEGFTHEEVLRGWTGKEELVKEIKSTATPSEKTDEEKTCPEHLIATGNPTEEAGARISELFTLAQTKKDETSAALAAFKDEQPLEVGEAAEKIIYDALSWKNLEVQKNVMEVLLDHPRLSLAETVSILDKLNEL